MTTNEWYKFAISNIWTYISLIYTSVPSQGVIMISFQGVKCENIVRNVFSSRDFSQSCKTYLCLEMKDINIKMCNFKYLDLFFTYSYIIHRNQGVIITEFQGVKCKNAFSRRNSLQGCKTFLWLEMQDINEQYTFFSKYFLW